MLAGSRTLPTGRRLCMTSAGGKSSHLSGAAAIDAAAVVVVVVAAVVVGVVAAAVAAAAAATGIAAAAAARLLLHCRCAAAAAFARKLDPLLPTLAACFDGGKYMRGGGADDGKDGTKTANFDPFALQKALCLFVLLLSCWRCFFASPNSACTTGFLYVCNLSMRCAAFFAVLPFLGMDLGCWTLLRLGLNSDCHGFGLL